MRLRGHYNVVLGGRRQEDRRRWQAEGRRSIFSDDGPCSASTGEKLTSMEKNWHRQEKNGKVGAMQENKDSIGQTASRGPTEMAGRGPEEHFQRRRPLPGIDGRRARMNKAMSKMPVRGGLEVWNVGFRGERGCDGLAGKPGLGNDITEDGGVRRAGRHGDGALVRNHLT